MRRDGQQSAAAHERRRRLHHNSTGPTQSLTAGLVNVQGTIAAPSWNDDYVGGAEIEKLKVNGTYLKIKHSFQSVSLVVDHILRSEHAMYERTYRRRQLRNPGGPINYNNDVLIIDMDQEYRQFTQELRLASSDDAAVCDG